MRSPADTILAAYFGEKPPKDALRAAITEVGVRRHRSDFSVLRAAVGTVLLGATHRGFDQDLLDDEGLAAGDRPVRRWGRYAPEHLFTIDWSDGHMGSSPSECAYFAVRLPTFKSVVVVLSMPTSEMFGYFDVALGHFASATDVLAGAYAIVGKHWGWLRELEMDRPQDVLREELVSAAQVNEWANSIWNAEDGDE